MGEQEEIAELIPPEKPGKTSPRAKYREAYSAYAARFEVSERTIKHWVRTGKQAADPCPLDAAADMAAWWERTMTRSVPAVLLSFRRESAQPAAPLAPSPSAGPPLSPSTSIEIGLEATLRRLQEAEAVASKAYTDALANAEADDNTVQRKQKRWQECVDTLRKVEKDLNESRRKSGDVVSLADIRQELSGIHQTIVQGFRGLVRRVRPKLATCETAAEQDALWAAEVDNLFKALVEAGFALDPDDLAA